MFSPFHLSFPLSDKYPSFINFHTVSNAIRFHYLFFLYSPAVYRSCQTRVEHFISYELTYTDIIIRITDFFSISFNNFSNSIVLTRYNRATIDPSPFRPGRPSRGRANDDKTQ